MTPPSRDEARERLARIIDPEAWAFADRHSAGPHAAIMRVEIGIETKPSFTKADAILALLSPEGQGVRPRPYPGNTGGKVSEYFGFDGGSLTIKTTGHDPNGSGWMCFEESDLEWEQGEDGKDYRILNLSNSELIFVRDRLCEVFPSALPAPPTKGGE